MFQPAEEGVPEGERGGAPMMLDEGLLEIAKPDSGLLAACRLVLADGHDRIAGQAP